MRPMLRSRLARTAAAASLLVACSTPSAVPSSSALGSERSPSAPGPDPLPRVIAYVNCLCGFGVGTSGGACAAEPDPALNQVERWEREGKSPITHYAIAFLAFQGSEIATGNDPVWAAGGGQRDDFELDERLRAALRAAEANQKRVLLSLGGELGSATFLAFHRAQGEDSRARVAAMRKRLERVARRFEQQNQLRLHGFDIDIELGGLYLPGSEKYRGLRELIDAVPERYEVALAPQVGNGACAAPVAGDPLPAALVLGADCRAPENAPDAAFALTRLDRDCRRADGRRKLAYLGVQYYNTGGAACCGGGSDAGAQLTSAAQHYVNLANGWPASSGEPAFSSFAGVGSERLVIGKPACRGCATDAYLDLEQMQALIARLDRRLRGAIGGLLFWDLCRMLGDGGRLCQGGSCQPSWSAEDEDALSGLRSLRARMTELTPRMDGVDAR